MLIPYLFSQLWGGKKPYFPLYFLAFLPILDQPEIFVICQHPQEDEDVDMMRMSNSPFTATL